MEEQRIAITFMQEADSPEWDEYVANHPHGTFFHASGWKKVLEKTFGYKLYYLLARKSKICGILPLCLVQNLLSGQALVSLPFAVYGGVCADDDSIAQSLIKKGVQITKEKNAGYMELRHCRQFEGELLTKNLYFTFMKRLPSTPEACLEFLPRKARAATRKAIDAGLTAEIGRPFLEEFYHVYAVSVRNLGSPVFSLAFLKHMWEQFPQNTTVLVVKQKEKTIAGVFTFLFKDTVLPYYAGSLPEYWGLQPNNFLYYKLMQYAIEKGYRYFDYGRSKQGTGAYDFKINQGFEATPLFYQYALNTTTQMPDTSSLNPKLKLAIQIWKRLPVWLTKILGPHIIQRTPP